MSPYFSRRNISFSLVSSAAKLGDCLIRKTLGSIFFLYTTGLARTIRQAILNIDDKEYPSIYKST